MEYDLFKDEQLERIADALELRALTEIISRRVLRQQSTDGLQRLIDKAAILEARMVSR